MDRRVEGRFSGLEEGFDLGRIRDVGFNGDGAWGVGGGVVDLGGGEICLGGVGGVIDDEFGAECGQVEGDCFADSTGAAGDDGDSVLEGLGLMNGGDCF